MILKETQLRDEYRTTMKIMIKTKQNGWYFAEKEQETQLTIMIIKKPYEFM